jgi:hypothetical protein
MSSQVQTTSGDELEAMVEPTFSCFVQSKAACRGRQLKIAEAYVPSVRWLFWAIRGLLDVDNQHPLTEAEIRPFVRCGVHRWGLLAQAYHEENGIDAMYPLSKTLALMSRWDEKLERKHERREQRLRDKTFKPSTPPAAKSKKFGDEGSRRIAVVKSAKKQKEEEKAAKKAAKQQRGR